MPFPPHDELYDRRNAMMAGVNMLRDADFYVPALQPYAEAFLNQVDGDTLKSIAEEEPLPDRTKARWLTWRFARAMVHRGGWHFDWIREFRRNPADDDDTDPDGQEAPQRDKPKEDELARHLRKKKERDRER